MARIEWIKLRLENWARWKARAESGGRGWCSQATFLNDYSNDRYREARIPIDHVEGGVTNDAVESLKPERSHLYETLLCIYPLDLGIRGTALHCGVQESTVHARLESADVALREWINRREERKKSFTS